MRHETDSFLLFFLAIYSFPLYHLFQTRMRDKKQPSKKKVAPVIVHIIQLDEFLHQYFRSQCQRLKILRHELGNFVRKFLHH